MSRDYFSIRQGVSSNKISLEHLQEIINIQFTKFEKQGYFQHQFGYECEDAGYVSGNANITLREQLVVTFGRRGEKMFPSPSNFVNMDIFSLFDLIEFLYDNASKPIDYRYHSWNDCGIHISGNADYSIGKSDWRDEMNKHLLNYEIPYTLTSDGNIEESPSSPGLENLIQSPVSHNDSKAIDNRIKHACSLFLKQNSTIDDKRDALKNLADVLEHLRNNLKEYVPNNEEKRLFEIANNFGIRHHNENQLTDYNQGAYYYWIFYSFLSTIDLLARLKNSLTK